jgi:peptidoglycan/LPS O-acetylase OafA/YrhL
MDKKAYFENLDGLRFLCFLSVFFYHSFYTESQIIKESNVYNFITNDIFGNGNIGVNFFFVLSGFLITHLLIKEKLINKQINVPYFWFRRVLRIWPLFYLCVIFGFFVFPLLKQSLGQVPNETASILSYLTFTNNFDLIEKGLPDASVLSVLWSVAVEEQFYLFWPIMLYCVPIKKYWLVFITMVIISMVFQLNHSEGLYEAHTLNCIGDLATGAFGAWALVFIKGFKNKIEDLSKSYIIGVYILFSLFYFFRDNFLILVPQIRIFEREVLACIILMIILEQCYSNNSFYKMSNFKIFSKLGKISFGLYMLHFIGILIVTTLSRKLGFTNYLFSVIVVETVLALAISIVISVLSFRILEQPFLMLKEKYNLLK